MSENTAERTTRRKVREGLVVSDKMDKTITVLVEDRVKHPLYGKVMTKSVRLKAHDEKNEAGMGDRVRIMETRPLSATKRWRLLEIVEKAKCPTGELITRFCCKATHPRGWVALLCLWSRGSGRVWE